MCPDLDATISVLRTTPQVITTLVADLPGGLTRAGYGANTWSVHEIVGHLIWGERTDWIPRLTHLLEHGERVPFEPFDRAGHDALCREHSLPALLAIFDRERRENLRRLESLGLTSEQLQARGRHPAFGAVTAAQLLATWAAHDLNHIAQICKALAYQWKHAVGPWEQYLSILAPPNPR